MKNKQPQQPVSQPETTKQSAKQKVTTRSNRGAPASSPQQSSTISQEKQPLINSKNSSGSQQQLNKSSHNSFQSPQLIADEGKESVGECYSTSTKMRREQRNTTDSKSLSSTKTTPLIVSPSKIGPNNKRAHPYNNSSHIQHSEEEMEESCRKMIYQQSFMANSQKIQELDNEAIKREDKSDQEIHMEEEEEQFVEYDHTNQRQQQQYQQAQKSKGTFNYRQPKQRDSSSKKKNQVDNMHDLADSHQQEIEAHEDHQDDHQSLPSEQLQEQQNQIHIEEPNQGTGLPEQDTEPRQSKIRIQKINFGGFSDSDDLTGPDSNSQNNNGNFKTSSKKTVGKSVTLIFSRKPGQNNSNINRLENNNNNNMNHSMSLREEIEGQQQSIQAGNLFISICNTDEHYPPLFNQKYLEDNISLIQKRQCHMRQKRRMLQLDSINSISIDKDNRLYNLLDERVIKEQSQGSIQVLNGIVEYEQSLRPQPVTKQKVKCNCKKTKCLKLYCDCFNQGVLCSPDCNCSECYNTADRKEERENAIVLLKGRNPDAFKPKIQTKEDDEEVLVHNKGCNCKKSGCEKKYCECYNTGVKCSDQCKCDGCKNRDPSHLIKNNSHNNSGINNPGGSISSSNNTFLWNNQIKSANMNTHNNNEHDYEYMFQSSLALGSNHHHLNQSLNNQRNNGSSSSPEDSLATFRQSSKKFNMGEYNADIPRQLNPGDSQQGYQKNKFLGMSSFAFSQQDEENNHNNSNINNNYVSSHNNQGDFFGGSNHSNGMRSKDGFFGEEGDKGNQEFRDQDNATVVSFQNGQISVIKQEGE